MAALEELGLLPFRALDVLVAFGVGTVCQSVHGVVCLCVCVCGGGGGGGGGGLPNQCLGSCSTEI